MKTILSLALLGGLMMTSVQESELTFTDRQGMIDAVTDIAAGADRHDWPRVRGAFADQVQLDYTSLWGGEVQLVAADDIIAQWAAFLPDFDQTHHMVTNHSMTHVDGDVATLEADFQATHRIDDETWTLLGRYSYVLEKTDGAWHVSALTMTWTHESGDRGLVAQAAERGQN